MSLVTVYGIPAFGWIPGPDFRAGFDSEGMWSGSQTFHCRKFDFESTPIQTAFRKGVSITTLYPNLSAKWNFLLVDEVDHEHQPNGVTRINVTLKGFSAEWNYDGEDGDEDSSGTYSMNATLVDRPIIEHPSFLALDANSRGLIVDAFNNRAKRKEGETKGSSSVTVHSMFDKHIENITTPDEVWWWNHIIDDGNTTWEASSVEWTKSATNRGGIADAQLAGLGWIDALVPGGPPRIAPRDWRLTGASDSRTVAGDTYTSEYSLTWSMSPPGQAWNVFKYTKP